MQIFLVPLHSVVDINLIPWTQPLFFSTFLMTASCYISPTSSRNVCSEALYPYTWSCYHPVPLFFSHALGILPPHHKCFLKVSFSQLLLKFSLLLL